MSSPAGAGEEDYLPGSRLGLPASGPGSVATAARRVAALLIDCVAAYLTAALFVRHRSGGVPTPGGWSTIALLAETVVLLVATGQTLGMAALRIRVVSLDGRRLAPWWAAVRQFLLVLLIPAVVWDVDRRGLHDKASGTVVVHA